MTSDFTRLERSLMALAGKQTKFAASQALNDCARAARDGINKSMPQIFDRPTRFTERAIVAPRELAATPDRLAAMITARPIQAQYLRHEEIGGTRTAGENTRKPGQALTLPGPALKLDRFGNIPNGTVARMKQQLERVAARRTKLRHAAAAESAGKLVRTVASADRGVFYVPREAARPNLPGGFWGRLPGHRITHLIPFAGEAHYQPRMHYGKAFETTVRNAWPSAMMKRLLAAIATAH